MPYAMLNNTAHASEPLVTACDISVHAMFFPVVVVDVWEWFEYDVILADIAFHCKIFLNKLQIFLIQPIWNWHFLSIGFLFVVPFPFCFHLCWTSSFFFWPFRRRAYKWKRGIFLGLITEYITENGLRPPHANTNKIQLTNKMFDPEGLWVTSALAITT